MLLDEYQKLAMRTNGTPNVPVWMVNERVSLDGVTHQLLNAVFGLVGEAGELSEDVKHALFHGRAFDRENAIKELGDLLWYVAQGADALGVSLEEVARRNVEKLKARYPEGFSSLASAARADERGA